MLRLVLPKGSLERATFELFESAYVAVPSGPSNLIATDVLARTGAAVSVARRLIDRPDGRGREGAASLQTHLHYAGQYERVFDAQVGGVRLRAPMMDIHTVAAGGGSILHYDGTPITARFIANAIGDHQDHLKVTPLRKAVS